MADSKELTVEEAKRILLTDIVKNLYTQYHLLSQTIQQLPIPTDIKHSVLYSIGSGYLWAKDAIEAQALKNIESSNAE